MAKKVKKRKLKQTKKVRVSPFNIYWEKKNYRFLALGIIVIIIGFYLMSVGAWNSFSSLVIAPHLTCCRVCANLPSLYFLQEER